MDGSIATLLLPESSDPFEESVPVGIPPDPSKSFRPCGRALVKAVEKATAIRMLRKCMLGM